MFHEFKNKFIGEFSQDQILNSILSSSSMLNQIEENFENSLLTGQSNNELKTLFNEHGF